MAASNSSLVVGMPAASMVREWALCTYAANAERQLRFIGPRRRKKPILLPDKLDTRWGALLGNSSGRPRENHCVLRRL